MLSKSVPNKKPFPSPLSVWWIAVLLGVAWVPPLLVEVTHQVGPNARHPYLDILFGELWVFSITLTCTGLAIASLVVQVIRMCHRVIGRPADKPSRG
jgi:hypothetical protein